MYICTVYKSKKQKSHFLFFVLANSFNYEAADFYKSMSLNQQYTTFSLSCIS